MLSNRNNVKKFKEDGGVHKWVTIAVKLPNGKVENTHVCEHTGYCPAFEGFVSLGHIRDTINARKNEEEYQEFKRKEIERITSQYSISCIEVTRNLVEEVLSFKKNFHIQKMDKFTSEIKKEFGDKVKIVSNMDELNEALKEVKDGKS